MLRRKKRSSTIEVEVIVEPREHRVRVSATVAAPHQTEAVEIVRTLRQLQETLSLTVHETLAEHGGWDDGTRTGPAETHHGDETVR